MSLDDKRGGEKHYSSFKCPNCGEKLQVECAEEAEEEHAVEKQVRKNPTLRTSILKAMGEKEED